MYWATTTEILLTLHELVHMNSRAGARHRMAAVALTGEQRHAHEEAAGRHVGFAQQLVDRLEALGALSANRTWRRGVSDASNSADARVLLQSGRARLLARYEQALAEPSDPQTRRVLLDQYEMLRAETPNLSPGPTAAMV